ncbi:MAG: GAF domain-containing protein, partial [Chloroflexota bacterium]
LQSHQTHVLRQDGSTLSPEEFEVFRLWNYGTIIAIPLISRDQMTGVLTLFAHDSQAFTTDQLRVAESLASQANIAMENARFFSQTDRQLQNRVDELAGLQRVSSELNSTLDLNRILSLVLEEAMRVTRADFGDVNLYDAQTGELVAHQDKGHTFPHTIVVASPLSPVTNGQNIMQRALLTGETTLIADVWAEIEDHTSIHEKVRSIAVVPIYYGEQPAGVINLESETVNFFNENQLRYLEALANQAAVAIGNAQAYQTQLQEREQASRRADQLSRLSEISSTFRSNRPLQETLEDVAYAIVEAVGYDVAMIYLVQDTPPVIYPEVGAGIPITDFESLKQSTQTQSVSSLKQVMLDEFQLGQAYFIPTDQQDVWQDKFDFPLVYEERVTASNNASLKRKNAWIPGDLLFIPLTDAEGTIIGLITVENPNNDQRPTLSSIQVLEIFANYAATAIENARLFELELERRRLADTLRGVAETISSTLDFDQLLNLVLDELTKVIKCHSVSVQRLDESDLRIIGGQGWIDSQQVMGITFSMEDDNPNRLVIETQEPIIVADVQDTYPAMFAQPPHDQIRGWLGVPLTYGTNILGLMALDSHHKDFFTPEDADVVLAFANQVAVAMQNARLFEDARNQVKQLAALTQVAQSLNRALDLSEVLNLVLFAVFDLVGHEQGSIWLIDHQNKAITVADTKNIAGIMVDTVSGHTRSIDDEPFASVINSGQVLSIDSNRDRPDSKVTLPKDVTFVPLKIENDVIGILVIESFIHSKNMLQLVTTLADLAAIAIDSTRLLQNTSQRANEMQSLYNLGVEVSGLLEIQQVMRSVLDSTLTLTQTQLGTILFWDDEAEEFIIEGSATTPELADKLAFEKTYKLSNTDEKTKDFKSKTMARLARWFSLTQMVMDTNKPLTIDVASPPDSEQINPIYVKQTRNLGLAAMLGVPVKVHNQTIGAIFIGSAASRSFDDQDIQILSFVANQAAVAMRNAQLVQRLNLFTEELERRVDQRTEELAQTLQDLMKERDRVEMLYQITRELSASFDLDRILTQALTLINSAVGISHGSILLLDRESEYLIYRAAHGKHPRLPRGGYRTRYKMGYGLAGEVMQTRQSQIVPDLSEHPAWIPEKETPDRRSALIIPLITSEEVVGVLLLFHPETGFFNQDHLKLVTAAASQVATAINNAELYRLITDQANRLGIMLRTQAAETAKNEAILNGITNGVLVLNPDRLVVLINPKAAEILEVDPKTIENQQIHTILESSLTSSALEVNQIFYDKFLVGLKEIEGGA